jgi:hypothetical protein
MQTLAVAIGLAVLGIATPDWAAASFSRVRILSKRKKLTSSPCGPGFCEVQVSDDCDANTKSCTWAGISRTADTGDHRMDRFSKRLEGERQIIIGRPSSGGVFRPTPEMGDERVEMESNAREASRSRECVLARTERSSLLFLHRTSAPAVTIRGSAWRERQLHSPFRCERGDSSPLFLDGDECQPFNFPLLQKLK